MSELNRRTEDDPQDSSISDLDDDLSSGENEAPPARLREGLPSGYRMRADAHYVEQLEAPRPSTPLQPLPVHLLDASPVSASQALVDSITRHGVLEPLLVQKREARYRVISGSRRLAAARSVGLREVPCLVQRVDDTEAAALAQAARIGTVSAKDAKTPHSPSAETDVLTSLGSITSCAGMVAESAPGLTRHVAVDLIRAEAWRATCLLRAAQMLKQGVAPTKRRTNVAGLVARLVESVEHERRLRAVQVDTMVSVARDVAVVGQEDTIVSVLSGLVLMTLELVGRSKDAAVLIAALPEPAGRVTLAISQDAVTVPESWPSTSTDAAGESAGLSTPLAVLAVRRLAEAYGGTVSTTRFANGSRLMLELPVAKDARVS